MSGKASSVNEQRIGQIDARRTELVQNMLELRSMCRGALSEQYVDKRRADGETVRLGPYYVVSRWEQGRNTSFRPRADEVKRVKEDLARHEEFARLCDEFARITEELGRLERKQPDGAEEAKKKPRSRRRSKRK